MISGSLKALRAARCLAASSTACPSWCDQVHDLTGDDRGISLELFCPERQFTDRSEHLVAQDFTATFSGVVVEKTDRAGAEQAMAGLELMGRGRSDPDDPGGG